jgi:two-component system sensor histidine kinase EvgS
MNNKHLILLVAACFLAFLSPISVQAKQVGLEIVAGSEADFPPYAIVDDKGRASGFSVELLEAVAGAMGLSIKVHTGSWPEVLAAFKEGQYDLLPLVALSEKRTDMASYTKPHTVAYDSFFVRKGSRTMSSLAEAKGREVVVMSSDAAHEALVNSGLPVRIIETKTIPEAMRLLASGKHDAVLVPKLLGLMVLNSAKLNEVIKSGPPISDYNRQFAFAVQRENVDLRDKLDQGLAIVRATGQYDTIYKKWFGGIEAHDRFPLYILGWLGGSSIMLVVFASGWVSSYRRMKALRESEKRFQALHDASFGGVIIHDKGLILDCNQGLSDMTGYTNEELIGMDGLKLIAPESLDLVMQNIQSGYGQRYEVEGVRKDGTKYPLSIKGKNVTYQGQHNVRVIEFSDITEIKQAEKEREEALLRIKKLEGIIPICMHCKKIRDDRNSWNQLEQYITNHSEAMFSHGICPECYEEQMNEIKNRK